MLSEERIAVLRDTCDRADRYVSSPDVIELLDAYEELQAVVEKLEKLPKCWRLNEAGERVQDWPVCLHDKVWLYAHTNNELSQGDVVIIHASGQIGVKIGYGIWERFAEDCYNTEAAAKAAREATDE